MSNCGNCAHSCKCDGGEGWCSNYASAKDVERHIAKAEERRWKQYDLEVRKA